MIGDSLISQGAEAKIYLKDHKVIKNRVKKSYRNEELDNRLRISRTRKEGKILKKAKELINVPRVFEGVKDKTILELEYLRGEKLSETLCYFDDEKQREVMTSVGEQIAKLHDNDIIHGDLTTSNILLVDGKVFFIDFGLGFISKRIEDRAVDLHLIKNALEAKHWKNYKKLFEYLLEGYNKSINFKETINQLEKVEKRGRYKH